LYRPLYIFGYPGLTAVETDNEKGLSWGPAFPATEEKTEVGIALECIAQSGRDGYGIDFASHIMVSI
jgi:hypothetical protein